jgi:hypothetical protein
MTARHKWDHAGERRLSGFDCTDGNARNERTCVKCGIVRITVMPPHGLPWHEWRVKDGGTYVGEATPPCLALPREPVPIRGVAA